jgi:hypothetical protein
MPLSSIQHEWLRAPVDQAGFSTTGASPDWARKTLTVPNQSSWAGSPPLASVGDEARTRADAIVARLTMAVVHLDLDGAECTVLLVMSESLGNALVRLSALVPCFIGAGEYVLERS